MRCMSKKATIMVAFFQDQPVTLKLNQWLILRKCTPLRKIE